MSDAVAAAAASSFAEGKPVYENKGLIANNDLSRTFEK
jgi:hypothetical protein